MTDADISKRSSALLSSLSLPESLREILSYFTESYLTATKRSLTPMNISESLLQQFFHLVQKQIADPFVFQAFHKTIRSPFDYYQFGLDFIRPLIDFSTSSVHGKENLQAIARALQANENVILLANHQTEIEPQIISLMLEQEFPHLAENMIFVAGHRVITDPLAIPFSIGRNLLCIHSKKYINTPPERKAQKIQHNQRTLQVMEDLLRKGGACIYIAPSGGRDRADEHGVIRIAEFDPDSLEMIYLLARHAKTKVHFHTLALSTYHVLPPPNTNHKNASEARATTFSPVHLFFGNRLDLDHIDEKQEKQTKRQQRSQLAYAQVVTDYAFLNK